MRYKEMSSTNGNTLQLPSPEQVQMLRKVIERFIEPTEEEWEAFAGPLRLRHIPKNGFFLKEGEVCSHVGFILRGLVRYYHVKDGNEYCGNFSFENSFVTEYDSFLNRTPSRYTFSALEPTDVLVFHYDDTQKAYLKYKTWERFGRLIAERIFVEVQRRKNSLVFDTPEQQYLSLIAERPKVIERVPQHMIATHLGISSVHLSRIRRKLSGK